MGKLVYKFIWRRSHGKLQLRQHNDHSTHHQQGDKQQALIHGVRLLE
jgi:hypothetical protein